MHSVNKKIIPCTDIYCSEINKSINSLMNFREAWLNRQGISNNELFQYGNDDFYFYRFAVSREEKSSIYLLKEILYKVMDRYGIPFEVPKDKNYAPFDFIINNGISRIGFRFKDFYEDDDIVSFFEENNVSSSFIIRTIKGISNELMIRKNEGRIPIHFITICEFFSKYISDEEYAEFEKQIEYYVNTTKEILGFQTIKFLSSINLYDRKLREEKILMDWKYEESKYQIIDHNNKKIHNNSYIESYNFDDIWKSIRSNYIDAELFKAMVGSEEFAESFITAEWLYHTLKGAKSFDYTAIVSGYLKSIEQLLYKLVLLNIDNGCVIALNKDKKEQILEEQIVVYEIKKSQKSIASVNRRKWPRHPYIDFTTNQKEYMDSSLGTFEFFLKNNKHIFIEPKLARVIGDMVSCFRIECRNVYFHTSNLHDFTIVDKIRENAIMLYAILIGSIKQALINKRELGIIEEDRFDRICKEIRETRHFSSNFIFEYADGTETKMIYDFKNNTIEFSSSGIEHYESLVFYEVDNFSIETYEMLDTELKDNHKVLLTRESLPKRIYNYDANNNLHEIIVN